MTIGEFWENVTVLCLRYDGKVISGPRSVSWNMEVGGAANSFHPDGRAADIEFRFNVTRDQAAEQAERLGLWVEKKNFVIHVQPAAGR